MGLILDTSAVIGWVENQSASLLDYLSRQAGDSIPVIHPVTLGELHHGVALAGDEQTSRRRAACLRFARQELDILIWNQQQAALFGMIAAQVSRKVSHNDCWIAAAALEENHTLVTQDRRLAQQLDTLATSESALTRWLSDRKRTVQVAYCQR